MAAAGPPSTALRTFTHHGDLDAVTLELLL
jgi:hypothetical protein